MPSLKENAANLFPGVRLRNEIEQERQELRAEMADQREKTEAARERMDKTRERMEDIAGVLDDVFTHRAYYLTGEQDMKAKELDSRALANLRRRNLWIPLSGLQGDDEDEQLRRDTIVPVSRRAFRWDPLTKWIVNTWTNFGHGQSVVIAPVDDDVQKWWREFWTARRNRSILGIRQIHKNSNKVLVDGEFLFAYFTAKDGGRVTVRRISTLEITELITAPDDDETILYYKRDWMQEDKERTRYYPDWLATDEELAEADLPEGAELAQAQDDGVDVDMMQVALTAQTRRGWPLMAASQDWNRAYNDFLKNRAAVSKAVATYVDRVRVDGGSRAVTSFTNLLQSSLVTDPDSGETNPVPAAGATAVMNKAVNWDRFNMASGASDAEIDGRMLFNMVGIGAGLFPHWLGHGESFRLATAQAMELPTLRNFQRYQMFWQSIWQDMFDFVLMQAERYGGQRFPEKGVAIELDPLLQEDLTALAEALAQLSTVSQVALPAKAISRIVWQAVGIEDIEGLLAKVFPDDDAGQERAAVKVADLAAMRELLKEAGNGGDPEALAMAREAFLDSIS